jgi:outer membrane receptor protein involved in Fe transport
VSGSYLQLSQSNYFTNQSTKVAFTNLLPSAGIQYSWKKQKNLNLNYSATNRAPQIAYMQPITNNNDPLNITEGNPNLTQSITHSISTSLNSFQVLKGRYLWGFANFSLPKNAFVQASWLDSNAVRRVMTVNANGNYSANGSFNYSHKVKKLPLSLDVSSSVNYSNNITFINDVEVTTKSKSLSSSAGISVELEGFELNLEYQLTYSQNNSSLSNQNGNSFITHMPNYDVEIQLPKKLIFTTEGNFNIRPKTNVFAQRNVYLMSAGLVKQFGKKNNFEVGFDIHDMLNQNIGFNRDISTNLVVDETYTQLSRYWLLKLKWNFSEAGGGRD